MSTRACYSFTDEMGTFHVYKHHDGYPSGAAKAIQNALPLAWPLPRFEASDFGAAFVAGNKKGDYPGGSVRLMQSGPIEDVAPEDIAYRYEIWLAPCLELFVTAFRAYLRADGKLWEGPLNKMAEWARQYDSYR